MLRYPLEKLDGLTDRVFAYANNSNTDMPGYALPLDALVQEVTQEAKQVKQYLLQSVFATTKKSSLRLLLQNYQAGCIDIADKLYRYHNELQEATMPSAIYIALQACYTTVITEIDVLLGFLEQRFNKYFDVYQPLPLYYYARCSEQFARRSAVIETHLLQGQHNDSTLVKMALQPVEAFIAQGADAGTHFLNVQYLHYLLEALGRVPVDGMATEDITELELTLLRCDFNADDFIAYFRTKLKTIISTCDSVTAQAERWMQYKQLLYRLPLQNEYSLQPGKASIRAALIQYIEDELMLLTSSHEAAVPSLTTSTVQKPLRIHMPVAQLAVLLRLFVEAGLIQARNQTEFLKRVASQVETEKSGIVSADSLRNKYYSPEHSALLLVKELLFAMIKQLNRMGR